MIHAAPAVDAVEEGRASGGPRGRSPDRLRAGRPRLPMARCQEERADRTARRAARELPAAASCDDTSVSCSPWR